MVDQIRFFAGAARMLEGRSAGEYMEGMTSIVRREPVGVCAQVAPWNYPMMMAVWKFAPALAAGNTVVLKPSDTTPASTVCMAEIIGARSLPKGVFNVICGDRDTGRADGRAPDPGDGLDHRLRAGRHAGRRQSAAKDVKRVHLELGGKAPVVVFDDADIAKAVEGISVGGLLQRRAGLHGRHPRARPGVASTTSSSPRSPRPPPTTKTGRPRTTRTCFTAHLAARNSIPPSGSRAVR